MGLSIGSRDRTARYCSMFVFSANINGGELTGRQGGSGHAKSEGNEKRRGREGQREKRKGEKERAMQHGLVNRHPTTKQYKHNKKEEKS